MVQPEKQYKFCNHNLSSLCQYLCITLVIKKLYEFEINTFVDVLILFIKLSTKTSQIRNSQEGLKNEGTFIKTFKSFVKGNI